MYINTTLNVTVKKKKLLCYNKRCVNNISASSHRPVIDYIPRIAYLHLFNSLRVGCLYVYLRIPSKH